MTRVEVVTLPVKKNGFCKCGSLRRPTKNGALCPKCDKEEFDEIRKKEKKKEKKKKNRERVPKREWKRNDKKGFIAAWEHRTGVVYGLKQVVSMKENGNKSQYIEMLVSRDGKREIDLETFTRKKLAIRGMRKIVNSSTKTVTLLSKLR